MQKVLRWTIAGLGAVAAAVLVSIAGLWFTDWDAGWVQAAAGLAAGIAAAPLSTWASKARTAGGAGRPTGWQVPLLPDPQFVDRPRHSAELAAGFRKSKTVIVQTLWGPGGSGKSHLAARYAHAQRSRYRIVWWIPASDPSLIGSSFAELAATLGLTGAGDDAPSSIARVLDHLSTTSGWLLIFDDAAAPRDLQGWLPSGAGHVLITSLADDWKHLGPTTAVSVMGRDEAIALVRRIHPGLDASDADRLADALGDLPLALVQGAGFMASSRTPVGAYLTFVQRHATQTLQLGPTGTHARTLVGTVGASLDQLEARDPSGSRLLRVMAMMAPEAIPHEWLDGFDPVGNVDEPFEGPAVRASLTVMVGLGLAGWTADGVLLHRLTRAIIEEAIPEADRPGFLDAARGLLARQRPLSSDDPSFWGDWARLLPHLLATVPEGSADPQSRLTACDAARYLLKSGQLDAGRRLAAALSSAWRVSLGEDHPDTLRAAQHHAHSMRLDGQYARAKEIDEFVAERRTRILGAKHPDTLWAMSNVAVDWRQLGDYGRAKEIDEPTLALRTIELGANHPDALSSASNLAVDWRGLGEFERARQLDVSTLELRRTALGPRHPDTLDSINNLAVDLLELRRTREGLATGRQALRDRRAVLGANHPDSLWTASNVALAWRRLGRHRRSRRLNEEVLHARRRILGPDHPDTLRSLSHLGVDFRNLGDHVRAHRLTKEAFDRRRAVLGEDHRDTRRSARNLAIADGLLGREGRT